MPWAGRAGLGTGCAPCGTVSSITPLHAASSTHHSTSSERGSVGFFPLEHKELHVAPPALHQLASGQFVT